MSSVMLAANTATIEDHCPQTLPPPALPATERRFLPRRMKRLTEELLFLAVRAPVYVAVLLFGVLVLLVGALLYAAQEAGLRVTRLAGAAAAAVLAIVCISGPQRAKAEMISATSPLLETTLVSSQQTNLYAFDAPGAGTLSISLKDWGFPVPLQQLTASILSQDQVLGSLNPLQSSDWSFDVPITGAGLFDAFVAAEAGSFNGLQYGAYSMSISFEPAASPVPLPPAVDLLLGGVGLLGAVSLVERISRRRHGSDDRNGDVISLA